MPRVDRIDLLQMFARILETGSLTAAGREQRLSQSAVSKRLRKLERAFGTRLLLRNTQGVRPTEAGRQLYRESQGLLTRFETLRTSLADAEAGALTGSLTLSVPMSLGEHVLPRLIVGFHALHPRLTVDMTLTDRVVDLVEDGVDLAVRVGVVRAPQVVARKVALLHTVLVATPAYLERAGHPRRVEDLAHHDYLQVDAADEEHLVGHGKAFRFTPRSWLTTGHSGATKQAVLLSAGISRVPRYLVDEELARGELVEVLPGVTTVPRPVSAVYLGGREAPAKVRALAHHLGAELPRQPGFSAPRA